MKIKYKMSLSSVNKIEIAQLRTDLGKLSKSVERLVNAVELIANNQSKMVITGQKCQQAIDIQTTISEGIVERLTELENRVNSIDTRDMNDMFNK